MIEGINRPGHVGIKAPPHKQKNARAVSVYKRPLEKVNKFQLVCDCASCCDYFSIAFCNIDDGRGSNPTRCHAIDFHKQGTFFFANNNYHLGL